MELKQNKDIRLWQYPVGSIVDHIHMNNMKIYAQEIYEEYIKWKDTSNGKVGIQIFCRGSSGSIIASGVAQILLEQMRDFICIKHIKKSGESSHSSNNSLFIYPTMFNVIVDDFMSSGCTVDEIIDVVNLNLNTRYQQIAKFHLLVIQSFAHTTLVEKHVEKAVYSFI